jgi:hypothetical protein
MESEFPGALLILDYGKVMIDFTACFRSQSFTRSMYGVRRQARRCTNGQGISHNSGTDARQIWASLGHRIRQEKDFPLVSARRV